MCPAVFLDRDGTLVEDRGCLRSTDEVVFFDSAFPSLRRLQQHFFLFIVTNQSGVAKGFQTAEEVERINRYIERRLQENDIQILRTYTCPHRREDECICIKPNPFFAQQASAEFGIYLPHSYAIGDHPHDAEFGKNFGGRGLYLLSGHGKKHLEEMDKTVPVLSDIGSATDWILARKNGELT